MSKRDIVNEIHKPARRNFRRRHVVMKGMNDLFQADLVEMIPYARENQGYKYILTALDTFSKRAWAIPIKSKSGKDVTVAMNKIFKDGRIPINLQTDMGKEFYNADFKALMNKYNINHYSTYSIMKASIVERFNRTLKSMMWKQFSLQGSFRWIDIIHDLIQNYNNKKHSTIGMKPYDVSIKDENKLLTSVYSHIKIAAPAKFQVGDHVRLSKYKSMFDKRYTPNWSTEIFKIKKIQPTTPVTYLLHDETGQDIAGGFYEFELQRTKYPGVYLVEKILRKKGNKYYVKWLGFNEKFNSYINKNDIVI